MKTRNGKIARLPRSVRDELNRRLEDGETAGDILPWLNALPLVQAILSARFGAAPVTQQNLTNWRQGGYQQWVKQQGQSGLVRELTRDANRLAGQPGAPNLVRHVSTVLVAELAASAYAAKNEVTTPTERLAHLRELLNTVDHVRREDYLADRVALDREWLEFDQAGRSHAANSAKNLADDLSRLAPAST